MARVSKKKLCTDIIIINSQRLVFSIGHNRSLEMDFKALLHYALFHSRFGFFLSFWIFSRVFTHVFDINMLVSKARVKMREKREEITFFPILHYALGKNASWLHFFLVFWNV